MPTGGQSCRPRAGRRVRFSIARSSRTFSFGLSRISGLRRVLAVFGVVAVTLRGKSFVHDARIRTCTYTRVGIVDISSDRVD